MIRNFIATAGAWLVVCFIAAGSALAAGSPGLSRALDAVLLPIDGAVAGQFGLDAEADGLVVVAMDPHGTAAQMELQPGDVLVSLEGKVLSQPMDVDLITGYWLRQDKGQLALRLLRGGQRLNVPLQISVEGFGDAVDLENVAHWPAVSAAGFSYENFYAQYSSELISNYTEASQMIEEASSSEEFAQEMQAAQRRK